MSLGPTPTLPALAPGLIATFEDGTISAYAYWFTKQITNYDASYNWSVSSTAGIATINSNGRVLINYLSAGQSATVTVIAEKSGYSAGIAQFTFRTYG